MSITINEEARRFIKSLQERLENRSDDFNSVIKKYGINSELITSMKSNLNTLVDDNNISDFLGTMLDLILYCHFGLIKSNPKCYIEGNKILFDEIKSIAEGGIIALSNDIDNTDTDLSTQFSIYSIINEDCSFADYDNNTLLADLKFLVNLFIMDSIDSEYNETVLNDIRGCTTSEAVLKCAIGAMGNLTHIMACLEELYANTFSLYPYVGVITFFGKRSYTRVRKNGDKEIRTRDEDIRIRLDTKAKTFKPSLNFENSSLYSELAENIVKASEIAGRGNSEYNRNSSFIRQERCFNLDDILDSDSCGLYYPYEAFGFATGSLFSDYYEPIEEDIIYQDSGFVSWRDYAQHIKPKIEDMLVKYIYKSLEKHCRFNDETFKFTDERFIEDYEEFGNIRAYQDYCNPTEYQAKILADVDKFVKTICRGVVITRNDCNELFKIKLISFSPSGLSKSSTKDIFSSTSFLQGSKVAKFEDAYKRDFPEINATVYEYTFCLDVQLMDKKPLFGYTAARLFQKSGQQISKTNILIGETEDGTPLFSYPGGIVDMSSKVCHRFSSGSRSGKGVMTMNILASSIASDVALFYVDRKPDMTAELAYISDGHMFCVNGGDLQSTDVHKMFYDTAGGGTYKKMLSRFNPGSSRYKYKYMLSAFGKNFGDEWKGAFGDLIYARAMILALGIVAARMYFVANPCPEAVEDLYLNGSVAVVIDEITNWHYQFEHKYFATLATDSNTKTSIVARFYNSLLGGSASVDSDLDAIASQLDEVQQELLYKYKRDIEQYRELSNNGDDKATKALKTAVSNLNSLLGKLQKKADKESKDIEETLYWTTYMEKYKSMIDVVSALKNAGIKADMTDNNDIYLIGQFISGYANTGDAIVFNKDGTVRQQGMPEASIKKSADSTPNASAIPTETLTRSYLLGFAETLGCDWFTGRNLTDKNDPSSLRHANFGGTHMAETDPKLDSWLHTRGNWVYIPQGTQETYRGGNVANLPQGAVKFKPYLVLNTNDEPARGVSLNTSGVVDTNKEVTSPYNKDSLKYYDSGSSGYVLNCAARVGFKEWETLRLQHVPQHLGASLSNPCYGHLEEGVGLKGLIVEYKRTNPAFSTYEFDSSCLAKSEQIANAVVRKFGYNDYMDYLLDLSPKGLIGCQDIINIYTNSNLQTDLEARYRMQLPRYYNSGNSALIDGSNAKDVIQSSGLSDDYVRGIVDKEPQVKVAQEYTQPVRRYTNSQNKSTNIVGGIAQNASLFNDDDLGWDSDSIQRADFNDTQSYNIKQEVIVAMPDSMLRNYAEMITDIVGSTTGISLPVNRRPIFIQFVMSEMRKRGF